MLVLPALVALVSVLSGPYSSTDSKILYTLSAALLGAAAFFAALTLVERGGSLLGLAAAVASPIGFVLLTYAIWQDAVSSSDSEGAFWAGTLTLITALIAVSARLLAHAPMVKAVATAAGVVAVVATVFSLDAALGNDQFWRVGTTITILWIVATLLFFLVPVLERATTRSGAWMTAGSLLLGGALAGVIALLDGRFSPQGYSILFTLIAAVLTASALLGGVLCLERGARGLGWTAVVVSPLGFAMLADGIWHDTDDRFRLIATGVVLAIALLVAVAARLFAARRELFLLTGAAGALAVVAAVVSIEGIWNDNQYFLVEKTTTALWILATLCCLLVPVLERYLEGAPQPEAQA